MRNRTIVTFSKIFFIWLALLCASVAAEAPALPRDGLLDILRAKEIRERTGYTLIADVEVPIHPFPAQGNALYRRTITKGPRGIAVSSVALKLPALVYHPMNSSGYETSQYDKDGFLHISMLRRVVTHWSAMKCEAYEEHDNFSVAMNGDSKLVGHYRTLREYNVVNHNVESLNWINEIWLGLGRGAGAVFQNLEADLLQADGLRKLIFQGSFMGLGGRLELNVDPQEGYLIRDGSLTDIGTTRTRMECTTTGTQRFGQLTLAKKGVLRGWFPGRQDVIITLVDFRDEPDMNHFSDVQAEINKARDDERVDIWDDTDIINAVRIRRGIHRETKKE